MKTTLPILALLLLVFLPWPATGQLKLLPSPGYYYLPYSFAEDDNYIYTGGAIALAGSNSSDGLFLSALDGTILENFPDINGGITKIAADGSGGWYVAGIFSRIGDYESDGLAHISADGSVSEDWVPVIDGTVGFLAIHEGMLYVAGSFSVINSHNRLNLARFSISDGSLDEDWAPEVEGSAYSPVEVLVIDNDYLYIGGDFSRVNDIEIRHLARISLGNGDLDELWVPGPDKGITDLLLYDDYLFVSGQFSSIGGKQREGIAKLHQESGLVVEEWETENGFRDIRQIIVHGGYLYTGGYRDWDYNTSSYIPFSGLNRYSAEDGKRDENWMHGIDRDIFVMSLSGDNLYLGAFGGIGLKKQDKNIANIKHKYTGRDLREEFQLIYKLYLPEGELDHGFSPPVIWGNVFSLYASNDKLLAGGWFILQNPELVFGLSRFERESGLHDSYWVPELMSFVSSILIEDDVMYAGLAGSFEYDHDDKSMTKAATKINISTQGADMEWGPDILGITVTMVADNNALYLGGEYNGINGEVTSSVQKISKADGQIYEDWGHMVNGIVTCMLIDDQFLYIGGTFTVEGYPALSNLARLHIGDGSPDDGWAPEPDHNVNSLLIHDNYIYAAGYFMQIGNRPIQHLARIGLNSAEADSGWNPDPDNDVYGLGLINRDIVAAGRFTRIGQKDHSHFARISTETGQVNEDWAVRLGFIVDDEMFLPDLQVNSLQVLDNEILIGGHFFYINNLPRLSMGRIEIKKPDILLQPLDKSICDGEDIVFEIEATPGEGELNWQWQQFADQAWEDIPGAEGPILEIAEASTDQSGNSYRCIVSDLNGSIISDIAILKVNPHYEFIEEKEICGGDIYDWHGIELSESGTYRSNYNSINICDSVYVLHLAVYEVDNTVTQEGIVLTANAVDASYQWVDCIDDYAYIAGATSRSFVAENDGSFAVIVTQDGCSLISDCFEISTVGIHWAESTEGMLAFPNPTTGMIHLEFKVLLSEAKIEVYDSSGKRILVKTGISGQSSRVDLSGQQAGTFIIQVTDKHNIFRQYVLKTM